MDINDIKILRELAKETAEIAALPKQEKTRALWKKLNGLKPVRPMVMIDQICWNEFKSDDSLTLRCEGAEARGLENSLRMQLYKWKRLPADMRVENFVRVGKAITGTGFGVLAQAERIHGDETSDIFSHRYDNQFKTTADLEKIGRPNVGHDEAETNRRHDFASEIFEGILEVKMVGLDPYLSVWDPIATWMGVENVLFALADDPEFMTALTKKVVSGYMDMLDQAEALGLMAGPQELVHCTGAWTDELPGKPYDPLKPLTKNMWMFGLAQMFSTVSPAMFEEYEIDACMPL
ncbi:MAG: hypothetical protein FWF03_04205, partial [Defluviitaleaceae bacterium]|nr:hypothetical protein [Defluviitaleaceae bacterium]